MPQAANGWVESRRWRRPPSGLLAGDLDTPRAESARGEITTFAHRRRGAAPLPERGPLWDLAGRRILTGLGRGVVDAFRTRHGDGARERSRASPSAAAGTAWTTC